MQKPTEFKDWLKNARLNLGMTQKEFAQVMGYSQVYVNYLEHGERFPGIGFIKRLSEITGTPISDIRELIY